MFEAGDFECCPAVAAPTRVRGRDTLTREFLILDWERDAHAKDAKGARSGRVIQGGEEGWIDFIRELRGGRSSVMPAVAVSQSLEGRTESYPWIRRFRIPMIPAHGISGWAF